MSQYANRAAPSNQDIVLGQAPQVDSTARDARISRQNSVSWSHRSAVVVPTPQRRPIPSPLQASLAYRTTSSPETKSPLLASPQGTRLSGPTSLDRFHAVDVRVAAVTAAAAVATATATAASADDAILSPAPSASPIGRSRPATNDRPSGPDEAFEEIKAAAARDALLEEAAKSRLENRKRPFAAPIHAPAAASDASLVSARRMAPPFHSPNQGRPEANPVVHRTASMDSTASSLSSSASQQYRPPLSTPQENITPQDIAALVASAGSPEAAILKLLQDKQQTATQTDQMWRIMEKQRTMIFGLKSDVERAVKKKDEYRKKLKDQMTMSAAGQSLASALKQSATTARADSQSPTTTVTSNNPTSMPEDKSNRRKTSDATDASGLTDAVSSSSTPHQLSSLSPKLQDQGFAERPPAALAPADNAPSKLQHAPLSASSLHQVHMPDYHIPTGTPPLTPGLPIAPQRPRTPQEHGRSNSITNVKLMTSPQGFSSPKDRPLPLSRKAPPAPLNLSPQTSPRQPQQDVAQFSESEYEVEDSEEEVVVEEEESDEEENARGRQKTRAADDRQREAFAMQEHSRTNRGQKSASSSVLPSLHHNTSADYAELLESGDSEEPDFVSPRTAPNETMGSMTTRLRAASDTPATSVSTQTLAARTLLSPGLPMSPRPGDRAINSPMPRAPKHTVVGMPMSPRDGNMPLSPRAPKGPLPLLAQTPTLFASTNVARAEAYDQLNDTSGTHLGVTAPTSVVVEPLSNTVARSPGEIYRGLASEQYPGLLLPPNALPSIFIKVDSSRLRPSRNSYMAPKQSEENPVFTLAIFARSDETQLWRLEKTLSALSVFDQQIKAASNFRTRLPERQLFTGHAPARIDARRLALGAYFDSLLDTPMNDEAATIVCGFLTADSFAAESSTYFPMLHDSPQPTPVVMPCGRPRKDGYLTKRGKNFGGWKARYFVLDGPLLKYFEAPGGALLGSIKLSYAQIGKQSTAMQSDEDIENQYRHAFLILELKRKDSTTHVRHVLCAESDDERDIWVECLLRYVDESEAKKTSCSLQVSNEAANGGRSPRLQKSVSDLDGPGSYEKAAPSAQGPLRSVPYQQTVAAEAPIMGSTYLKGRDTPSPPIMGSPVVNHFDDEKSASHPTISGPTNATVIQDVQSWGNKSTAQTPLKDKKRSIFGFGGGNRGRASSDTATSTSSPSQQNDRMANVRPVFGVPLAEAVEFSAPIDVPVLLPAVAYRCIEYLKAEDGVSEEGIFRLSGSNIIIKALRERFNTEGDINLVNDESHYDVHAVASLLKQYLRELPANILTREMHFDFLSTQEQEEKVKLEACNVLVNRLPRPNRELLEALTGFLREIVDNEKVNKMSVRNGELMSLVVELPHRLTFSSQLASCLHRH